MKFREVEGLQFFYPKFRVSKRHFWMNLAAWYWAPICINMSYFWSGQFYWIQGRMLWSQNSSRNFLPLSKIIFYREVIFHFKVIKGHLSKNHCEGWLLDFLVVLSRSWTPFTLNLVINMAILMFWTWSGVIYFSSLKKIMDAIFMKVKIVIMLLFSLGSIKNIKKVAFWFWIMVWP